MISMKIHPYGAEAEGLEIAVLLQKAEYFGITTQDTEQCQSRKKVWVLQLGKI